MRPYKGVGVLLKALEGLEDIEVKIVGSGPLLDDYRGTARSMGLKNVEFTGKVSDEVIDRLFADSHVVVLPSVSRMEAFGIVLLEGMRAGCVPVASRLPGVEEVVDDAGLVFPPGDHMELKNVLSRLRDDPGLRKNLSVRAKKRASSFVWDDTVERYLSIMNGLVKEPGAS